MLHYVRVPSFTQVGQFEHDFNPLVESTVHCTVNAFYSLPCNTWWPYGGKRRHGENRPEAISCIVSKTCIFNTRQSLQLNRNERYSRFKCVCMSVSVCLLVCAYIWMPFVWWGLDVWVCVSARMQLIWICVSYALSLWPLTTYLYTPPITKGQKWNTIYTVISFTSRRRRKCFHETRQFGENFSARPHGWPPKWCWNEEETLPWPEIVYGIVFEKALKAVEEAPK